MSIFDLFENFTDSICALSKDNEIVFKNKQFSQMFSDEISVEKLKNHFNFNICMLSSDNIANSTPIDFVLSSNEPFHTVCSYQKNSEEYYNIYIYSFNYNDYKIIVFKDITSDVSLGAVKKRFDELSKKYEGEIENINHIEKLQENAQSQVLKMALINRISLLIRETNDIGTILASALEEIHNFLGSYKTYFAMKERNHYKIKYCLPLISGEIEKDITFEDDVNSSIKQKEITLSSCLKEYIEAKDILQRGITRVIIPVYNKHKLLGIIATYTKHRVSLEDNKEIFQSAAAQLAGSIIQYGLIIQLNKKNVKLRKILSELKETQLQLINTEKMASVGQLVSGVAHEINTPIASITSNSSIIAKVLNKNELEASDIQILKEMNQIDSEAAKRITDIVKSLKRFVRLDEAEFQFADINNELDLTLKLTAHELKNSIKVIKNYGDIPPVLCSINMLNQVFMNLIVNACQSILSYKNEGTITITTSTKDNNLIVKIKDDGQGISQENINNVFNVGFTTKPKGIGTGLGLSISKKIIELHKGEIKFHSKENEGCEFEINIPVNRNST
ncbi:ATP-binding protein [bacterium]|nr:ATP-binding protein [bacterium]